MNHPWIRNQARCSNLGIFHQAGDAERATSWFKKMRAAGFEPDLQVWRRWVRWAIGDGPQNVWEKKGWHMWLLVGNVIFLGGLLIFDTRHVKLIVFGPCLFFLGESSCGSVVVFLFVVVWRISWCLHALLEKSGLQHSVECSCKSWRHQCSRWGGVVTVKAGGLAEGWECSEWKPECKRGIHKDFEWIMNKSMIWTYSLIISSQKKSCTEACSKPNSYIPSRQLRISGLNPQKKLPLKVSWPNLCLQIGDVVDHITLYMSWSSQRKTLRGTGLHARRQMQVLSWKHSHSNNDGFCNKIGIPLWLHSSKICEN